MLNNALVMAQYEKFKLERSLREVEKLRSADEKAKREAALAELCRGRVVTCRVSHKCHGEGCQVTIQKGAQATVVSHVENVSSRGWTPELFSYYYCVKCRPIEKGGLRDNDCCL